MSYVRHYRAWNGAQAGRLDDATCLEEYQSAVNGWPENALWHQRIIEALVRLGRVADARRAVDAGYLLVDPHPRRDDLLRVHPARVALRMEASRLFSLELIEPLLELPADLYPEVVDGCRAVLDRWEQGLPLAELPFPTMGEDAGGRVVLHEDAEVSVRQASGPVARPEAPTEAKRLWVARLSPALAREARAEKPLSAMEALAHALAGDTRRLVSTPTSRLGPKDQRLKGQLLSFVDVLNSDVGLEHATERWIVGRIEGATLVPTMRDLPRVEIPSALLPSSTAGLYFAKVPILRDGAPMGPATAVQPAGHSLSPDALLTLLAEMSEALPVSDAIAVYMLDIGQGDCSVVLLPDDRVVILDCADDRVLRKVLDNWNIRNIEAFVLSHLDHDHIAGALQFLQAWPHVIGSVHLSADRDITANHEEAQAAKRLVDHAKKQGRDEGARRRRWELVTNERDGRPLAAGTGWSVKLLAPSHGQQMDREREGVWEEANRYSSILRVQVGQNAMLIGGDAPLLSWSELPPEELEARAFRIPHHGGALSDGGIPDGWDVDCLYRVVGAETALLSVGTNNGYGHPVEQWVKPLTGGTCRLLCTQVTARCHAPLEITTSDGAVVRDSVEIKALRARVITKQNQWVEPQYRHLTDKRERVAAGQLEVPCAGTVVVTLFVDGRVDISPSSGGAHERIIDAWEHPLCRSPAA